MPHQNPFLMSLMPATRSSGKHYVLNVGSQWVALWHPSPARLGGTKIAAMDYQNERNFSRTQFSYGEMCVIAHKAILARLSRPSLVGFQGQNKSRDRK